MALFFREDQGDGGAVRETGFARYRQVLSFYAGRWLKLNLITLFGALPLLFGIFQSVMNSSLLLLLPSSLTGGLVFGPFLAALYDSILRGLRDAPGSWRAHYRRSWSQNVVGSLLPGALLGLMCGVYTFMIHMLWSAEAGPGWLTLLLYLFSALLLLWVNTLYWPQLVLFRQRPLLRLENALLFTLKHPGPVLRAVLVQLAYLLVMVLFAPWTLLLLPITGLWYPVFVAQLLIYPDLNEELQIEAQFIPLEGDPWRRDRFEREGEAEEP